MSLKKILLLSFLLSCAASLWAVPAKHRVRIVEQPDGTQLSLQMRGDEHFHYLVTTDGVPVMRQGETYYYAIFSEERVVSSGWLAHDAGNRTPEEQNFIESIPDIQQSVAVRMQRAATKRNAAARAAEVPAQGTVRVPVLLVQYADVKFSTSNPKTAFQERINGEDYTAEGGCGSVREYFVEQSGGLFNPQFEVIGPITLEKEMAYYGANNKNGEDLRPREMVEDACRKAFDELGTDFKLYDNNRDGYVDIVYIIYAGYGEASYPDMLDDTIWPHQWQLGTPQNLGGVNISCYACNNELDGYKGTVLDGIGTFCHEFSHCLGLPDFYDTSSGGKAFGMNSWSVMDQGCYNNDGHTPCGYNAYEKDFLGWISLVELNDPTHVTLKPLNEGGEAYKIVNDANPNEFYVVEYFSKAGWNQYAPASGMIVLHVDYLSSAWHNNVVNNDPNHQRVYVIPADGKATSESLVGDIYPGLAQNTSLTANSRPAAKVYAGGYMNKDITNITSSKDGVTTFTFMQNALSAPRVHIPSSIHSAGFTLTWDETLKADAYDVLLTLLEEGDRETVVHTVRVSECSYTFEGLSEGIYRCFVRSVRQGVCSEYSDPVQVQLVDTSLPSAGASPHICIRNDSVTIQASEGTEIYYTLDGSHPTIYSTRYMAPFTTTEKVTIKAIAFREAHRNTPVAQFQNWFAQEGVTYRITSTVPRCVVVSEAPNGNGDSDYCGHYIFGDSVVCDTMTYAFVGFDTGAFSQAMELRSVTVEGRSIQSAGDSLFYGCIALNAVVWDVPIALPDNAFDEDSYRNLLVYLPDTTEVPASLVGGAYTTVIKDGYCEELSLDATSSFFCPREFVAGKVTYRRTFKQTTGLGTSSGWETLVLPFDVQCVTHATKGEITPFGREGDRHFWLATPRNGIFAEASEICANTPYIMSMPNNDVYGEQSLAGSITFSAVDALIRPTLAEAKSVSAAQGEDGNTITVSFYLYPTYELVEAADGIYALNVGAKYMDYAPGSVFVSGRYDTPPFSVCLVPEKDQQLAPFYRVPIASSEAADDTDESDMPKALSVTSRDGYLYVVSPVKRTIYLRDAVGRLLRTIVCEEGTTEVGPLDEGVYIIEKTKIYVER